MKKLRIYSRNTGFLSMVAWLGARSGVMKPANANKQLGTDRTQMNLQRVENYMNRANDDQPTLNFCSELLRIVAF